MGSALFSDTELIQGLISRDERVLKEFYQRFYQGIRRYVRSNSGTEDDARDIFHDAIIVLFRKFSDDNFTIICSIGTYLFSVSRYLWLKELERRRLLKGNVGSAEAYIDPGSDIAEISERNERLLHFRKCFNELPEDCRKVLTFFIKGYSIAELTEIMGYSSEQYTRNRRYRCKATLIKHIRAIFD